MCWGPHSSLILSRNGLYVSSMLLIKRFHTGSCTEAMGGGSRGMGPFYPEEINMLSRQEVAVPGLEPVWHRLDIDGVVLGFLIKGLCSEEKRKFLKKAL